MSQRTFIKAIPFGKLNNGSHFRIFAEPSRRIFRSRDTTVYRKVCDAWSSSIPSNKDEASKDIILYPNDLVVPLTNPNHTQRRTK